MATVLYDPSESREGSRLPQDVIDIGRPLVGLERITGADLLITTAKFAPESVFNLKGLSGEIFDGRPVGEIAKRHNLPFPVALLGSSFKSACDSGILVQRKTGTDLINSIPDLAQILYRMLKWTSTPWLLFVGKKYTRKGFCCVDGTETKYTSASVSGALAYWQLRGGYYSQLSYDSEVKGWVSGWLSRLHTMEPEKVLPPREVKQQIVDGNEKPWRSTLLTIPGWGIVKVNALAALANDLAGALEWLTLPDWITDKSSSNRPNEITKTDVLKARDWFGLGTANLQLVVGYQQVDNCTIIPEEK